MPVSGTIASAGLYRAAAQSREAARRLRGYELLLGDDWSALQETDFAGSAAVAAIRKLEELTRLFAQPATALDAAADLLEAFASARQRLEKAQEAVIALLDFAVDAGPLRDELTGILRALNGLGTAMDWACARGLDTLCTPEYAAPGPGESFGERADLPVDAIHELEMLTASPEVRRLAEANSDIRVLETPGKGVVAAVGDVESAESITTFVAGVNSANPGSWQGQVEATRAVAGAMGPKSAGVVWLGYRAPDGIVRGLHKAPAEAGGRDLARFQRGLARRYPGKQRVVVGHSYGTVVASQAAKQGLHADDLVLLGSPGTGARHVRELNLYPRSGVSPRVFAATSQGDAISLTTGPLAGVHGRDPASPLFGAEPWPSNNLGDHGSYFTDPRFLAGFEKVRRG